MYMYSVKCDGRASVSRTARMLSIAFVVGFAAAAVAWGATTPSSSAAKSGSTTLNSLRVESESHHPKKPVVL